MGDALSPAMTIGTCAWMEREWMASLHDDVKGKFMAKRYMDDIALFMIKDGTWDHQRFYEDFQRSECYMAPLKLEAATDGTFLETQFKLEHDRIRFRLKNVNEDGEKKVWRYQAWDSYTPHMQKCSTLVATLKKVDFMAGDDEERGFSALHKLREFQNLGYPVRTLRDACARVYRETGRLVWAAVAMMQK